MSTVIEFRSPIGRAGPREGGPTAGEIIIFPGVRRERHAQTQGGSQTEMEAEMEACDVAAKSKRHSRARPKRDRIELPD